MTTPENPAESTHILVLNSGSSSFKFSVFTLPDCTLLLEGAATSLNTANAELTLKAQGKKIGTSLPNADHKAAIQLLLGDLENYGITQKSLRVAGHRIVHGGEFFHSSVVVDESALIKIEQCSELAPLHNPAHVLGIRLLQAAYPDAIQVAVFDTAFHQTLPPQAYMYALPYHLYQDYHIRRYGFHGTSHRYVAQQCCEQLNLAADDHQLLIAHLGNGCSATAVVNGESVDTTMGLTPSEGAVMGTRAGTVDPGLHLYLQQKLGWSLAEITDTLNKKSGLLGLSEVSNDMRELIAAAERGNSKAQLAIDVFCFRIASLLGGLATSLTRIDALVFTAGIGENSAPTRAQIVQQLRIFNLFIEPSLNQNHGRDSGGVISTSGSIPILVVPTNEERQIALDCIQIMEGN